MFIFCWPAPWIRVKNQLTIYFWNEHSQLNTCWLTLGFPVYFRVLVWVFKILNSLRPDYLKDHFLPHDLARCQNSHLSSFTEHPHIFWNVVDGDWRWGTTTEQVLQLLLNASLPGMNTVILPVLCEDGPVLLCSLCDCNFGCLPLLLSDTSDDLTNNWFTLMVEIVCNRAQEDSIFSLIPWLQLDFTLLGFVVCF